MLFTSGLHISKYVDAESLSAGLSMGVCVCNYYFFLAASRLIFFVGAKRA